MSLELTIIDQNVYTDEEQRPVLQVCMEMSTALRRTLAEKTGEPIDTTSLIRIFHFRGYLWGGRLHILVSCTHESNRNWTIIESLCKEMFTRWQIWLLFKETAKANERTTLRLPTDDSTFYLVVPENRYDTFTATVKRFIDESVSYHKSENEKHAQKQNAVHPYVRDEWLDVPLEDAINRAIDCRDEETFKQLAAAYNALQHTLKI